MNFLVVALVIATVYIITFSKKNNLQNKFKKLGDISGMNKEEIISVLGQPNSESILVNGMHLLQWQKNHCHIGIVFDNHGNFIRISNQGK